MKLPGEGRGGGLVPRWSGSVAEFEPRVRQMRDQRKRPRFEAPRGLDVPPFPGRAGESRRAAREGGGGAGSLAPAA